MADRATLVEADGLIAFDGQAFASPTRLLVHGAAPGVAARAWHEVVAELEAVDAALSRFRDDSEVTRLCRATPGRGPLIVGRRLRVALALAERARRVTHGRVDPRVLRDLERLGDRGVPIGGRASSSRPARPEGRVASIGRAGVALDAPVDLGGIGKGLAARWAADRAMLVLGREGGLLLDLGGDLVAAGRPLPADWRIGIEDPSTATERPLVVVRLATGGLATSSIRNRRWRTTEGRSVHHLIDPRTGEPGGIGLAAVTVAHADPAWAEILSKSLFLAGADRIADEARARDLAAWWVDVDGGLAMTPAGRQASAWVDEARVA